MNTDAIPDQNLLNEIISEMDDNENTVVDIHHGKYLVLIKLIIH